MIVGIGVDIVAVERMAEKLAQRGDQFAERLLLTTEMAEYQECRFKAAFLAKRFAVKEAAAKALGIGFAEGVGWRQIGTGHDEKGCPILVLQDAALARAEQLGVTQRHVSVSDEQTHAVGLVILEK